LHPYFNDKNWSKKYLLNFDEPYRPKVFKHAHMLPYQNVWRNTFRPYKSLYKLYKVKLAQHFLKESGNAGNGHKRLRIVRETLSYHDQSYRTCKRLINSTLLEKVYKRMR
jgi:hypothetical protein